MTVPHGFYHLMVKMPDLTLKITLMQARPFLIEIKIKCFPSLIEVTLESQIYHCQQSDQLSKRHPMGDGVG